MKTSQPVDLPRASLRKKRGIWVIWAVPVIAALVAGGLILTNIREAGPLITIIFNDGNGLQANQTIIKYRGTRVGEVRSVQLTADLQQVVVQVRLQRSAAALAQAGSQFWIVRPEVSSGGLHGLETIVSGPYIQAQPGQGEPQKRFIGSAEPPVDMNPGGRFEVMVTTPQINTLSIGSPVYYRGVEVGSVSYFVLDDDARLIRIHLLIGTNFAPLVRLNSKFWNAGGINVRLKFIGVDLSAENLKSLIIGGIAFATPDGPGSPAPAGTLFTLFEKPNKEWLDWSPSIAIPNSKNGNNDASPPPALLNKLNPAD